MSNNDAPDPDTGPLATGFADLGLTDDLLTALSALGYEEPTPIQRQAIPELLGGRDLVGQAATGTGKTAAFALPILNRIASDDAPIPQALIVVPTRELAVQVSEAFYKYGRQAGIKVVPVFGGQPIHRQFQALRRGVHVVVATPGRALDHIKRGSLALDAVRTVVLDEADEMLDMGFTEDIEAILDATPDSRQTVLFSATMPPRIAKIAETYQRDPVTVKIGTGKSDEGANPRIRQTVYMVMRAHKASALGRILDVEAPASTIVFCRTRTEVDELTETMNGRGYRAEALHGGMDQLQRDRVMGRLRDGTAELLIATDVAARGLDVDSLTHVVNYDVPSAPESYVHRIGRVGRAGREGVAITIAEPRQRRLLANIERLTKQRFEVAKVPTVADLRSRQVELTVAALREALDGDDLDDFGTILDALHADAAGDDQGGDATDADTAGDEVDAAGDDERSDATDADAVGDDEGTFGEAVGAGPSDRDIALAAIKLVHLARGATLDDGSEDLEIPDASEWKSGKKKDRHRNRPDGRAGGHRKGKGFDRGERGDRGRGGGNGSGGPTGYVHVNIGRRVGLRPGDLVGAIANEAGLSGSDIGPIRIADHYAVVGVPESEVDTVLRAMKRTTIRGTHAKLRRFVE
ncbi:MAG: DEAD/DEAH box helicase [Actinomycetota bacterium]